MTTKELIKTLEENFPTGETNLLPWRSTGTVKFVDNLGSQNLGGLDRELANHISTLVNLYPEILKHLKAYAEEY